MAATASSGLHDNSSNGLLVVLEPDVSSRFARLVDEPQRFWVLRLHGVTAGSGSNDLAERPFPLRFSTLASNSNKAAHLMRL